MNDPIQAILRKANDSLQAAKLLAEQQYLDFAASRAYYAMFYTAEALLLKRGLSYSSHSAVIAAFGKEYSKTGVLHPRFHQNLIAVQDYRNQGDYDYGPSVSSQQVQNALLWAEEFLATAKELLGETWLPGIN